MKLDEQNFVYVLMILESNILARTMGTTFLLHYALTI
jgi:hypothetical protein